MKLDSLSRILAIAIIGSAVLLAGSIAVMTWSWRSRGAASDWLRHSYAVRVQVEHILSAAKDLERAARDYLLTREGRFLDEVNAAGAHIETEARQLQTLSADDAHQAARAEAVLALTHQKRALVARFLGHAQRGAFDEAVDQLRAGPGRQVIANLQKLTREMLAEEDRLLALRVAALERAKFHQVISGIVIAVAELLLIAVTVYFAKKIRDLQRMVTICAWSKQVRHKGEWISIEDYLERVHRIQASHGLSPRRAIELKQEIDALNTTPPAR